MEIQDKQLKSYDFRSVDVKYERGSYRLKFD